MPDRACSIEECERRHYARGYCEAHYRRLQRTGELAPAKQIGQHSPKTCSVEACDRLATERGLCHGHYLRLLRHGDVQATRPLERGARVCAVAPKCTRPVYAKGLCRLHYRRWRRTGDPQADVPPRGVGTGGYVHHGYRYVQVPRDLRHLTYGASTYSEHRFVMSVLLGRPLTPDESVHHRDGDRLNNSPGNLELWTRWQPSGQRAEDKVAAAKALLQRYAPELLSE